MMKFDQKRKVWLFADTIQVSHGDIKVDMAHQLMTDDKTGSRKALAVEMAITHSDFINLNNRLYLGSSMKDDTSTWTKPYQKPVIRKHDMSEDPIGRVYSAQYIQEPGVGASVNATLSNKDEVLRFLEAYKPSNKPSGHIKAGFYVADPDAINKWLDGRYQTVSIGFQTQEAFCSKCGANFSTMTPDEAIEHEHEVGQDGCHLMVGHILYEHLAVVNLPADEFTHVQSIKWAEQTFGDSVRPKAFFINGNKTLSLGDEAATPMSQINLPKEEKVLWPAGAKLLLESADAKRENYVTKEGGGHQHRVILDPATENGNTDYVLGHSHDVLAKVIQTSTPVYDYDQELEGGGYVIKLASHSHELGEKVEPLTDGAEVKYINEFVCDDNEETFSEDDNLAGLLFMDTEYEKGIDELITAGTVPADAKLSTEKRKGLPSSAFCGPSRSFPVSDCCLEGNTEIKLLDGRLVKIANLPAMLEAGEKIWVYSFDTQRRAVVPAEVTKAWLAIQGAPLLKVTLDDGAEIFCTANHPFLTRDMTYRRADELCAGDSLLPLYTALSTLYGKMAAYEKIFQPWYGYWEYTHKMVARESAGRVNKNDEVVHHLNENKRDNAPINLVYTDKAAHIIKHALRGGRCPRKMTEIERTVRSNFAKIRMAAIASDPDRAHQHAVSLSQGRRTYNWDCPNTPIGESALSLIDVASLVQEGVGLNYLADQLGVKSQALSAWLKKANLVKSPDGLTTVAKTTAKAYFLSEFGVDIDAIYADFAAGVQKLELQRKYHIDRDTIRSWFARLGYPTERVIAMVTAKGTTLDEIKAKWKNGNISLTKCEAQYSFPAGTLARVFRQQAAAPYNHSVVSVTPAHSADVYDIEVPRTNNFALAAGVFVHNSHYTAALRLLNRAKFSDSTKAKVHACIVRKGKALGCTSEKDEQTAPIQPPAPLALDELLVREDVKAHIKSIEGPMQATITKLEAQVVALTQQVKELEAAKTGDALTSVSQQEQITALVDQNVRLFKRIRSGLVDNIILKTQLTNDGPLADSMKPAAGESTEDCIARVRNILNTESTEALQTKLDAVTKVGQPILQKLAPSADEAGKAEDLPVPAAAETKEDVAKAFLE